MDIAHHCHSRCRHFEVDDHIGIAAHIVGIGDDDVPGFCEVVIHTEGGADARGAYRTAGNHTATADGSTPLVTIWCDASTGRGCDGTADGARFSGVEIDRGRTDIGAQGRAVDCEVGCDSGTGAGIGTVFDCDRPALCEAFSRCVEGGTDAGVATGRIGDVATTAAVSDPGTYINSIRSLPAAFNQFHSA